jgi:enoyl-CoA hydratase
MAKKMYLGGLPVSAREALRIGLVDEVGDADGTVARALELARSFTAYAEPAQAGLKRLIDAGYGLSGAEAGTLELDAWCASYVTDDARARLREFSGRGLSLRTGRHGVAAGTARRRPARSGGRNGPPTPG